ncbi:MAG: tetratricopeptide repeat protein [Halioglobus sp.]
MTRLHTILFLAALLCSDSGMTAKESVPGISKQIYDAITEIQTQIEAEQWQQVRNDLVILLEREMNGYERAHVLNMLGYAYFQDNDYDKALDSYLEALQQENLPASQMRSLLTTASQVALASGRYQEAEKFALRLLAAEDEAPQPQSQVILAQAYIGLEDYAKAAPPLRKALQMQRDSGAKPRENWMLLLSSVYYSLEDFAGMRELLYEMVALYPKERYLINLAALHGQLGDTDKQMALIEALLDDQKLEKSYHLMSLVNLFLAKGLPYKAANLLQTEMQNGRIETTRAHLEMQSQAWYMAGEEEKAIPPLAAAAAMSDDGELYLRVARLYMDNYQWQPAELAARKAIEKGSLRSEGNAWLVVGMALARGDKLAGARSAFIEAANHEQTEKWARQWLNFVDNEQERIAALTPQ